MTTRTLVVAGHGMAGHRLVEEMLAGDRHGRWRIVVLAEEPRPAYDRVALSTSWTAPAPTISRWPAPASWTTAACGCT